MIKNVDEKHIDDDTDNTVDDNVDDLVDNMLLIIMNIFDLVFIMTVMIYC